MALPRPMNMAEQEAALAFSGRQEAELKMLAEAIETFMAAYRKKYTRPATDGIRSDAPLRSEASQLNAALRLCRTIPKS